MHPEQMLHAGDRAPAAFLSLDVATEFMHLTLEVATRACSALPNVDSDNRDAPSSRRDEQHLLHDGPFTHLQGADAPTAASWPPAATSTASLQDHRRETRRPGAARRGLPAPAVRRDEVGRGRSDRQLPDEDDKLVGWPRNTANALTWASTSSTHVAVAHGELRAEVDEVLQGCILRPTADRPNRSPSPWLAEPRCRARAPPGPTVRRAIEDDIMVDTASPPTQSPQPRRRMHRDPGRQENPAPTPVSAPRTFLVGALHAYFPLFGGPRQCIGKALIDVEATLVLALLAHRFDLHLVPIAMAQVASHASKHGRRMTAHPGAGMKGPRDSPTRCRAPLPRQASAAAALHNVGVGPEGTGSGGHVYDKTRENDFSVMEHDRDPPRRCGGRRRSRSVSDTRPRLPGSSQDCPTARVHFARLVNAAEHAERS